MKTLTHLIAACALLAGSTAWAADEDVLPLASDDIAKYREAGEWTVFENRTRKSCFISRSDDAGNLVQMGLTRNNLFGYVGIFRKDAEIPEGEEAVAVIVNDNLYVGSAKNVVTGASGNYSGGYILANDRQFRIDLEKSAEMIVFPDMPFSVTVNLGRARDAIFEARECTGKLRGA